MIVSILISKYGLPIPQSAKSKWKAGIKSEIRFWDDWFCTKGLQWPDQYRNSFDPNLPLQPRPAALLPPQTEIHILDVGAGPLTFLGKIYKGKRVTITAVDPYLMNTTGYLIKTRFNRLLGLRNSPLKTSQRDFLRVTLTLCSHVTALITPINRRELFCR